jgi:soluble lytic murein transglycosylase-like protein
MALTFGQLASGAGAVSTGMRQAEEAQRVARENQLKIEAQNRANEERSRLATFQAGLQVPAMPNFTGGTGGQQFGIPQAAPAAPAVPVAAIAPSDMDAGGFPLGAAAPTPVAPTPAVPTPAARVGLTPPAGEVQAGVGSDTEQLGVALDKARTDYTQALAKLRTYGLAQQKKDPSGYNKAKQAVQDAESLRVSLQKQYEAQMALGITGTAAFGSVGRTRADAGAGGTSTAAPKATPQAGVKEPVAAEPTAGAKPSTKVAAATKSYDNANTPYNDLMNQAAQQYGLDPVVFKRLIGTESSFNPNAVSPRGESFGLGIGQIAEVHGLTREQRLDPNVSIPKAAEIFAQYLREANGDYTAALMRYKGASSERGIAAMQEPVATILNGTNVQGAQEIAMVGKNPGQTADRVATAAAAPATSGVMFGPTEVAGGAQNPGVQSALMLRQMFAEQYRIAAEVGSPDRAMEALAQVAAIDLGLYKAQADQGIYELESMGDASRAMSVLSQFTGTPTQALSRGDGTYDLYRNGRVTQTAVPVDKLADLIKTTIDAEYRASKIALAAERSGELFKKDLELRNKIREEVVKAQGNISKAATEGRFKLLEKQYDVEIKPDTASGTVVVRKGDKISYFDPRATTEIRGEQVPASRLIPVR